MLFKKKKPENLRLVIQKGPDKGRSFVLSQKAIIGRDLNIDITLADTQISREHLQIEIKGEKITLKDLGSSNGTFVDDKQVKEARIQCDQVIRIGQTVFTIIAEQKTHHSMDNTSTERVILTAGEALSEDALTMIHYEQAEGEQKYEKSRLINLMKLSNRIYATLDLQQILNVLMESIFDIFPSTEKSVLFLTEDEGLLVPASYRLKDEEHGNIQLSRTILDKIKEKKSAILSTNVMGDAEYKFAESLILDKINSFMCSPMYIKNILIGVFYVDTTRLDGSYTEDDLRFFLMICNQIAMSIYNARLYSEIRDMAQYNANVLACISSGIIVIDNEGKITNFNRAAGSIFNLQAPDVLGRSISSVEKLSVLEEAFNKTITSEDGVNRVEVSFVDEDDQKRIIGLGASIMKDHNQYIKGVILFFRDLTEINKLNELLARSERLAALGEMAAGVAHEIRNPLNSIRGFAQLFNEGMVTQDKVKEFSEIIMKEVDRLNGLVVDLLDFSREHTLNKTHMDIKPLIDLTISYVKQGRKDADVKWDNDFPGNPIRCDIDADKIKQVLINLYQNALDALHETPEAMIKSSLGLSQDGKNMLVLSIQDNGPGMSEKTLKKIFNPFYSTKKRGSGLGLAITQRIIEEHGGYIDAGSEEGKGTTFRIYFPLKSP